MLFNSLQFLVFCLIILPAYFIIPDRYRWGLLLLASVFFYLSIGPFFIIILMAVILFDYITGYLIEIAADKWRTTIFIMGITGNIAVLIVYKYYNFINQNIGNILSLFHTYTPFPFLSILVPIGLSYITFQSISYKIEIYRKNIKAERNPGIYALYLLLFTKVIAGPIERPQYLLPQFRIKHEFDFELFKSGLMQMAFGFFKKTVIADRLAIVVDSAYQNPSGQNGMELFIATIFYSFQIYCDFSGYTDVALGASKVMGIHLTDNFNKPYFSKSISEFWRRWHISFSLWLRDYIFLPLAYGVSRKWKKETYLTIKTDKWIYFVATGITFLICGIWHGAAWHYILWGCLFGFYLCFSVATSRSRKEFYRDIRIVKFPVIFSFTKIVTTFLLISFAWIFFRADSIEQAVFIIYKIGFLSFKEPLHFSLNRPEMIFSLLLIVILIVKERFFFLIPTQNTVKWVLSMSLLALCIYFFGIFDKTQFIYFQF